MELLNLPLSIFFTIKTLVGCHANAFSAVLCFDELFEQNFEEDFDSVLQLVCWLRVHLQCLNCDDCFAADDNGVGDFGWCRMVAEVSSCRHLARHKSRCRWTHLMVLVDDTEWVSCEHYFLFKE